MYSFYLNLSLISYYIVYFEIGPTMEYKLNLNSEIFKFFEARL